jgi:DNA-binding NarL/FixJ family response regulator
MLKKKENKSIEISLKKKKYNICVVDESPLFIIGLKVNLEKYLAKHNDLNIISSSNIKELKLRQTKVFSDLDILIVEYKTFKSPDFKKTHQKLKRINPQIKIVVSSSELIAVDFDKVYTSNINGFFSKRISRIAFVNYIKKIFHLSVYFDHQTIGNILNIEKEQQAKMHYKSIGASNIEAIQNYNNLLYLKNQNFEYELRLVKK